MEINSSKVLLVDDCFRSKVSIFYGEIDGLKCLKQLKPKNTAKKYMRTFRKQISVVEVNVVKEKQSFSECKSHEKNLLFSKVV